MKGWAETVGWTNEQYTAIYARDRRLLVSAAAGSGKTAVLVARVLARITREESPDSLDDLVILTFTNAAASEMRTRISEAIGSALAADPGNRALRGQFNRVQTARIMTIHAFCAKLIRENFHLLGINPEFRIISGEEEDAMRRETLGELLEKEYSAAERGGDFLKLAECVSGARDDSALAELILRISAVLRNDCDPEGLAERLAPRQDGLGDAADTVWGKICIGELKRDVRLAAYLYDRCEKLALENGIDGNTAEIISGESANVRQLLGAEGTWEQLRSALESACNFGRLTFRRNVPEDVKAELKNLRDTAKNLVKDWSKEIFSVPGETLVSDVAENAPCVRELLRLSGEFSELWQEKKLGAGVLGFDDMEHYALKLLSVKKDGVLSPSEMALEYGSKIKEIMVDEYQDTNAIQDEIFKCLAAAGAELFVVGDVKQSIYRFRKAEPRIFLSRRRAGAAVVPFSGSEGETRLESGDSTVTMRKNFRSLPSVTDSVNAVFRKLMTEEFGEMGYRSEDELVSCRTDGSGEDNGTEFDLLAFGGASDAFGDGDEETALSARETEAGWIAERIGKMLLSGRKVFDKETGGYREIRPGDIAVLTRSAMRRIPVIAEALTSRGIPVSTDAGGNIFTSAEVNAAMSMFAAVDNPGREIALVGYLRSPLEGFSADDLGRVRIAGKGLPFYRAMKQCAETEGETAERCRSALARLEKMRLAASDADVGRAVGMLLDMSGAFVVFGSMEGGAARRANLTLLTGLASSFAERGGQDLGGFVRSLERAKARGDEFSAPKVGTEGVRLMTIHASKGLEFPVVFLANTMERMNTDWKRANVLVHRDCGVGMMRTEPERFVRYTTLSREAAAVLLDKEQYAEELRLLYVAMTRAREKLVVTGICQNPGKLRAALRTDGSPDWIGAVCRKKASLGCWLLAACEAEDGTAVPVKITEVPAEMQERKAKPECVQEKGASAADPEMKRVISERVSFVYPYAGASELPAKMTATGYSGLVELAGAEAKKEQNIAPPDFMRRRGGLTAAERGVAVHLAMQLLPQRKYSSAGDASGELDILERRGVFSARQRSVISPRAVKAFYDSELGEKVLSPENRGVRREFKFSVLAPAERFAGERGTGESVLLQGVIDLFWENSDGSLEIADYKTDAVQPGEEALRAEGYRSQLGVYRYALSEMLGKPVKSAYVWFFRTETAVRLDFDAPDSVDGRA